MTLFPSTLKTLAVVVALVAVGCEVSDLASVIQSSVDFGDEYTVVREAEPMFSVTPPRLGADRLELYVRYGGGCAQHDFRLHMRRQGNTTELWLHHDANGDRCEAYLTDHRRIRFSHDALDTEHVVLLAPDGPPIPLR